MSSISLDLHPPVSGKETPAKLKRRVKALAESGDLLGATVAEAGGILLRADLPAPESFRAEIDRLHRLYVPGCGELTHVAGTNGGRMRCGAKLRELDGTEAPYFCAVCQPSR